MMTTWRGEMVEALRGRPLFRDRYALFQFFEPVEDDLDLYRTTCRTLLRRNNPNQPQPARHEVVGSGSGGGGSLKRPGNLRNGIEFEARPSRDGDDGNLSRRVKQFFTIRRPQRMDADA